MEEDEILGLSHWKEGFEESRTGARRTWRGAIASSLPLSGTQQNTTAHAPALPTAKGGAGEASTAFTALGV